MEKAVRGAAEEKRSLNMFDRDGDRAGPSRQNKVRRTNANTSKYTTKDGTKTLAINRSDDTRMETQSRASERRAFLENVISNLYQTIPSEVFGAELDEDEIKIINLKQSRHFPTLVNGIWELKEQGDWMKDLIVTPKQRTTYYRKQAEHLRGAIKDCERAAKAYDTMAERAEAGDVAHDKRQDSISLVMGELGDLPPITEGLGLMIQLKEEDLDHSGLDLLRWEFYEKLSVASMAERIRRELELLLITWRRAAKYLTEQELDVAALIMHLNDMVKEHGKINIQEYSVEEFLPLLRMAPGPYRDRILAVRNMIEPPNRQTGVGSPILGQPQTNTRRTTELDDCWVQHEVEKAKWKEEHMRSMAELNEKHRAERQELEYASNRTIDNLRKENAENTTRLQAEITRWEREHAELEWEHDRLVDENDREAEEMNVELHNLQTENDELLEEISKLQAALEDQKGKTREAESLLSKAIDVFRQIQGTLQSGQEVERGTGN
ncbi:hypothetical protein GP486_005656 [Trichoglossum hirsutum]|uniref:Uncharacterized protein n=1 Tax=Trichoglossum hirsutum TaxID=265104 RepID=A0A9P8RMB3_9PEZI|nr:hypothetical protein GP486_005656 [Trichoglossum hirsutum]